MAGVRFHSWRRSVYLLGFREPWWRRGGERYPCRRWNPEYETGKFARQVQNPPLAEVMSSRKVDST